MGFGGGFFRRITENRERRARGEQPTSAPRPTSTPTPGDSLRDVINNIISSRQSDGVDTPPNPLPGLGPGQGRGPNITSNFPDAGQVQSALFQPNIIDIIERMSEQRDQEFLKSGDTPTGQIIEGFLSRTGIQEQFFGSEEGVRKLLELAEVDRRGGNITSLVEGDVPFDINTRKKQIIEEEFTPLKEIAANEDEFFALFKDSGIPTEQIEAYRQDLVNANTRIAQEDMVDAMLLSDIITSMGGNTEEAYNQLFQRTPYEYVQRMDALVYSEQVKQANPNIQVNDAELEKIIKADLAGDINDIPAALLENRVRLLAEAQGFDPDTFQAYVNFANNSGMARDQYPQHSQQGPRSRFERTFSAFTRGLEKGADTVLENVDEVFTKYPQRKMTEVAISGLANSVGKTLWGEEWNRVKNPVFSQWDRVPDEAKRIVEQNFWTIKNMEGTEAENFLDTLEAGPPQGFIDAITEGEKRELTDDEYREWVQFEISSTMDLHDTLVQFGGEIIFDPLNLLLVSKIPKIGTGLNQLLDQYDAVQTAREGAKGLGITERVGEAIKTRNIYYTPGAPTVVMAVSPKLRNLVRANEAIVNNPAEIRAHLEMVTSKLPKISFRKTGVLNKILNRVPNPFRSRVGYSAQDAQASELSIVGANSTAFLTLESENAANPSKKMLELLEDLHDAYRADPENFTEVNSFFKRYGFVGNEGEMLLTHVIGDKTVGPEIISSLRKYAASGKTPGEVRNKFIDLARNGGEWKWQTELVADADKLRGGGKLFAQADRFAYSTQQMMRHILSKVYLSTPRFHVRNITNDSLRMSLEGTSPLRNTTANSRIFTDVGINQIQGAYGPLEISGKQVNKLNLESSKTIRKLTDNIEKPRKTDPAKFLLKTFAGDIDQSISVEQSLRLNVNAQSFRKSLYALEDDVRRSLSGSVEQLIAKDRISTHEIQAVYDEVITLLDTDMSPGAFERIIKGVREGRLTTKPNWARLTGVDWPKHLDRGELRRLTNKLVKFPANDTRANYLANRINTLNKNLVEEARKFSPTDSMDNAVNLVTDQYMTEMNFWIGKGLNMEEALARTLPAYTNRLRKSTSFRAVNHSIREIDPDLARDFDQMVLLAENKAAQEEAQLLGKITKAGDEYKRGADGNVLMNERLKIWDNAYNEARAQIVITARQRGINDLGFTGTELRTKLGVSQKLGFDEIPTGVDTAAAFNLPAMFYMEKMVDTGLKNLTKTLGLKSLTGQSKKDLVKVLEGLRTQRRQNIEIAQEFSRLETDRIVMNYFKVGDADFLMKFIMPWQFWPTRAWPRYMDIVARKPYLGSHYARIEQALEDDPRLARLRGKLEIPFLGEFLGVGDIYVDPTSLFIPTDFFSGVTFESDLETAYGGFASSTQRLGLGINPIVDMSLRQSGIAGNNPFAKSISLPHWEILAQDAVSLANWAGLTDREFVRITPATSMRIQQELVDLRAGDPEKWDEQTYNEAVLEWNQQFPLTGNLFEQLSLNPQVTNPMLAEAVNRAKARTASEQNLSLFTGLNTSIPPPEYMDFMEFREDARNKINEAFRQNQLGNEKPLEELLLDPDYALAINVKIPSSVTEREAARNAARSLYFGKINVIDDDLDMFRAGRSPFDPEVQSKVLEASQQKQAVLAEAVEKYGVNEDEIINPKYLSVSLGRISQQLIRGEITPSEAANAFGVQISRGMASLLTADPNYFIDQDGVFAGGAYHEANENIKRNIPSRYLKPALAWRRRDATPQEAVKDAWNEMFISPIFEGINRINQELDKEIRSEAIDSWTRQFNMPSNDRIILWLRSHYPNLDIDEAKKYLEETFLPNFEQYSIMGVQEEVTTLKNTGQPFRSSNDTLVNESNVEEFIKAYDEFTIWKFAKNNDIPTRGLWTDNVEKYFGSGAKNAENIKNLAEINSKIDRILANSGATSDEDLRQLLEGNSELVELLEQKNELSEAIVNEDRVFNLTRGRTTSGFRSSGNPNETDMFTSGGVAVVLARGKTEWLVEIGKALQEGRELSSSIASELFAIFQRNSLGYKSFNSWLLALYKKWLEIGRPGKELVSKMLGEKAKELGPGETTGIVE